MNVEFLRHFVAAQPGTPGQHFARSIALDRIAACSVDHAAALTGLVGPDLIPAMIEAEAPPAMLRAAITHAVLFGYRELRGINRSKFSAWCGLAEFTAPEGVPEVVSLYRGIMGCSPAAAATGLHWSLSFDDAAFYAARFADTDLTGVIVLHARVPRDSIAVFVPGNAHQEVIPADVPASYETIIDKARIGDAAARAAARYEALLAQGWKDAGGTGVGQAAAMATRARMAAAGVVPGTAIVPDAPAGRALADIFIERARQKLIAEGAIGT